MGIKNFLTNLLEDESDFADKKSAEPVHPAVACFAAVLRSLGDHGIQLEGKELGQIKEHFQDLALRAEHADEKHLKSLQHQVVEYRKKEASWVSRNLRELAETVVGVIQRLGRSFSQDQGSDREVEGQLTRLRGAVAQESIVEIRREVLQAVDTIAGVLQERGDRQRKEMAQISAQLDMLKQELSRARKELATDGLTQVYNRASFDEQVQTSVALAQLSGRRTSLMMIDIDFFKAVNDTHGHQAGDQVLRMVADALVRAFPRKSDFVARYGGEEFAVILAEDGRDVGQMLAGRMLERIRGLECVWESKDIPVTVSVGIAELGPGSTSQEWISRADKALYDAKRSGRDRCVVAPDLM